MMKKILFFISLHAIHFVLPTYLLATSLVGTSSIVYKNANYIFRNGDTCEGFVRLDDGFTILAGATVTFDTFITVSAGMDLRSTGNLSLFVVIYFLISTVLFQMVAPLMLATTPFTWEQKPLRKLVAFGNLFQMLRLTDTETH